MGGISERDNRILFGASAEALPAVEAKLRELDVPCYLVALEVAGPVCDSVLRWKSFRVVEEQGEPVSDVEVVSRTRGAAKFSTRAIQSPTNPEPTCS